MFNDFVFDISNNLTWYIVHAHGVLDNIVTLPSLKRVAWATLQNNFVSR